MNDKIAFGLAENLEKYGLNMKKCRDSCMYGNGTNMAGLRKGVESRVIQEHKLAYSVPCAVHSLIKIKNSTLIKKLIWSTYC